MVYYCRRTAAQSRVRRYEMPRAKYDFIMTECLEKTVGARDVISTAARLVGSVLVVCRHRCEGTVNAPCSWVQHSSSLYCPQGGHGHSIFGIRLGRVSAAVLYVRYRRWIVKDPCSCVLAKIELGTSCSILFVADL